MTSSTVVTNSASAVEPAKDPSGGPDSKNADPQPRKGPRRASSPAGSPARSSAAPALLVFDADGMMVLPPADQPSMDKPATQTADDAGSPLPEADSPTVGAPTVAGLEEGPKEQTQPDSAEQSLARPDTEPETKALQSVATDECPDMAAAPAEPEQLEIEPEEAPQTRRARRLAEDGGPTPAVEQLVAGEGATPAKRPAVPAVKHRNRVWTWARGLLFLILITIVVLSLGTVVSNPGGQNGASATEVNREASWTQTSELLAQARAARNAETDAATKAILAQSASGLEFQLTALAGVQPAAEPVAATAAPVAGKSTAARFAQELADSANTLLANSLTASGAMGRTFAAAGTNRLLLASALDRELGKPVPESQYLPTTAQPVPDNSATCKAIREPQSGTSDDAALTAAAGAEQKAVYAYQVAGSRLAGPDFSRTVELTALHQNSLALLNAELERRCLPVVAPVPGFVLAPDFTNAPTAALAKLEGDLVLVYGDLTAFSGPVAEAATPDAPKQPASTRNPAEQTAPPAAPTSNSSRPTGVRGLAVAGLVGSASRQQEWGGNLSPLPGIPDTLSATPSAQPSSAAAAGAGSVPPTR